MHVCKVSYNYQYWKYLPENVFNPLYNDSPYRGSLANSEYPDEMLQHAAFHQGSTLFAKIKTVFMDTKIHHILGNSDL